MSLIAGRGMFGVVSLVSETEVCKTLMKRSVDLDGRDKVSLKPNNVSFELEKFIAQHASDYGVGPLLKHVSEDSIVMERMDGTLRSLLHANEVTMEDVVQVFVVMQSLHRIGIWHNDLHAANVLFRDGASRTFKLSDFGQALYYGGPIPIEAQMLDAQRLMNEVVRCQPNLKSVADTLLQTAFSDRPPLKIITNDILAAILKDLPDLEPAWVNEYIRRTEGIAPGAVFYIHSVLHARSHSTLLKYGTQ